MPQKLRPSFSLADLVIAYPPPAGSQYNGKFGRVEAPARTNKTVRKLPAKPFGKRLISRLRRKRVGRQPLLAHRFASAVNQKGEEPCLRTCLLGSQSG